MSVSSHRQLVRFVERLQMQRRSHTGAVDPSRVAELWPVPGLPRSAAYDPGWFIATGLGAPNVLWLTELLSQVMDLYPGMRVLDLGCGTAQSSIFLAREFGVSVWAADLWVDPTDNWRRIQEASEAQRVVPLSAEAHDLPFADGFFDAIVSLDAYHYFGTDERYLPALLPLLRPGGQLGVVAPGNTADPEEIPDGLPDLGWPPSDFFTFRSAAWWRRMWLRSGQIEIETADMVTGGHEIWARSLELEAAWFGSIDGDLADGDRLMLASEPGRTLGFARVVGRRPPAGRSVVRSRSDGVRRVADTVVRPGRPWTPAVHDLLRHLERVGFDAAPRPVADGLDDHGNQVLTFVEGASPHPHAWSDAGVAQVGALLRALHDATATFEVASGHLWQPWPHRSRAADAVIGHGDLGPWNVLARNGMPVAFIDWETAGPIDRLDEVALTAMLNAQLHADDVAERVGLPSPEVRANQLRLFVDGYGLGRAEREQLIPRMIQVAIVECAREADEAGVTPDRPGPPSMIWGMAWRARGATWILRHRLLLEGALLGEGRVSG